MSSTAPHYKAVFVSPHLDDAVFSCAGEIARLRGQGPVLVLNLFTKYPEKVKVHRRCSAPSARNVTRRSRLPPDSWATHRIISTNWMLTSDGRHIALSATSSGHVVPEDAETYLPALRKRVFAFLDALDYERLYVPMAIGWHVDHLLTHLISQTLGRSARCSLLRRCPLQSVSPEHQVSTQGARRFLRATPMTGASPRRAGSLSGGRRRAPMPIAPSSETSGPTSSGPLRGLW